MDTKRSNRSDIYDKIIDILKKEPLSISEISKQTGLNWETTKRNLEILRQVGVVGEEEIKNKRVFSIKDITILEGNQDTLLGLPLREEQREATKSLFKKVKDIWNKNDEERINKTFLQKIAVKIIKDTGIKDIPYGWYLFGMMSVLQCDPSQEIEVKKDVLGNSYNNKISEIVIYYQKNFKNTNDLMIHQYLEEGNDLYLTKLKLQNDFLNHIEKEDLYNIHKRLTDFIFNFKKTEENKEIIDLVEFFVSIVGRLINKVDINEIENIRPNILGAFESLWKCIATYNLYDSLVKNGFYKKEELYKYYLLKVIPLIDVCKECLSFLNDFLPKESLDKNSKLYKLMGSAKELSPEEKKKREKELEKIREEKGEKGLQEFLLKEFGLD